jgi:aspartate/methionine/tyrosine aminotransferase
VEPHGAFYFFFRVDGVLPEGEGSAAFCQRLMEEAGVALVPGAAFGDDRWVRMSYATDDQTLEAGLDRLLAHLAAVRAARAG